MVDVIKGGREQRDLPSTIPRTARIIDFFSFVGGIPYVSNVKYQKTILGTSTLQYIDVSQYIYVYILTERKQATSGPRQPLPLRSFPRSTKISTRSQSVDILLGFLCFIPSQCQRDIDNIVDAIRARFRQTSPLRCSNPHNILTYNHIYILNHITYQQNDTQLLTFQPYHRIPSPVVHISFDIQP